MLWETCKADGLLGKGLLKYLSKKAGKGIVEYKLRKSAEIREFSLEEAVAEAEREVAERLKKGSG